MKTLEQAEQDVITLDYSRWSFQQQRAGKPSDHASWEQARDLVLFRQKADNQTARKNYEAKLEAEKAEKAKLTEAEIDAELEPKKLAAKRQWLVDHPGKTSSDFEKQAWPLIRQGLVEERKTALYEASVSEAKQRYTGALSI